MIKLIILEDEKPIFNPEVRMFAPFRAIIEKDRGSKGDNDGRKKRTATKELAFVYWFSDPRSMYYESYQDEPERTEKIKKLIDLPEDWVIDEIVRKAILFYQEEINEDFDVQLLDSGLKLFYKAKEYLDSVDFNATSLSGKKVVPLYSLKEMKQAARELPSDIEALKTARLKVLKSLELNKKIRGSKDGSVGRYEN